jgi:hypothetical protein
MKKRTKRIVFVITAVLSTYIALYFIGVSPDGPIDSEERIPLIYGWSPSYNLLPHFSLPGQGLTSDWNDLLRPFFNPIHQIDRNVRKSWWLTPEEKEAEIRQASKPLTPFTYDMAVVEVLDEPPQPKKGRTRTRWTYLGLLTAFVTSHSQTAPQHAGNRTTQKLQKSSSQKQSS